MPNCTDCPHDYFCCRLRVKTNFWERLRIRLQGQKDFIEKDALNRKILKFKDNQCIFLENNQCKIYKVRPKPCRGFPFQQTCQESYQNVIKLNKKILNLDK